MEFVRKVTTDMDYLNFYCFECFEEFKTFKKLQEHQEEKHKKVITKKLNTKYINRGILE